MRIDLELSPAQAALRDKAKVLAVELEKRAGRYDAENRAPVESFELLKDAGFVGLSVPKEYGGLGAGLLDWTIVAEELARGCPSTAMSFNMHVASAGIVMGSAMSLESAKERVAGLLVRDKKILSVAISEPGSSSLMGDTLYPSLLARQVDGGYRLTGNKGFISNWEGSDYGHVFARLEGTEQTVVGLLVPTRSEGISVERWWDTLGMRATQSQKISFEDTPVSADGLVQQTDDFLGHFFSAKWGGGYSAVYLGVGMAILEQAKAALAGRVAKGYSQPMGYHPDIRAHVAQMQIDMECARAIVYRAAWFCDNNEPGPATMNEILKAKFTVGEAVKRTLNHATNACGLHALFKKQSLERLIRDGMTAAIMPPNSDACAGLIGLLALGLNPMEAMPPLK